ncbi:YoaK family protein [Streptosporangium carneum]|uniref:Membrane protein n=1 Tax=Streptosporangium carneum TaxID=47481 RepID=A0A9W6HYJ2_9ACTN|nr:YoaK family protein [Streptosporangium carneum]GLK08403.1 membrane protein [Streptosporangium carneum]
MGGLRWVSDALFVRGENRHGILPALLIVLTATTGLVDAVSFLGLNRVFVANMTGNVVFLGFALAGDSQLSAWASLLALAAFVSGAWSAGRLAGRMRDVRREFTALTVAHAVLVAVALMVAWLAGYRETGAQVALIGLLGYGMGMQNAAAHRLAVPDLITITVLTSTLTRLAVDPPGRAGLRRSVLVAALFCGALAGAALHLNVGPVSALAAALILLVTVAVASRSVRHDGAR